MPSIKHKQGERRRKTSAANSPQTRGRQTIPLVAGFLFLLSVVVYWQVWEFEFTNYDDDVYVTENGRVLSGLSWQNITWAFTTGHAGNWHPVTWVSHMLDVEMFGLDPGGHHFTSVVIHAVNAVILFLLLSRMTGTIWRAAGVAALFAIHPLHVESVAWVAERKDVLSTLFLFITFLMYLSYISRPTTLRYAAVVIAFILGLMAKPMLVTLPFVLLVLDFWPLNRLSLPGSPTFGSPVYPARRIPLKKILLEKAPLLFLALCSSVVTLIVQQKGGALSTLEGIPLHSRVLNALLSYVAYIGKTFWPVDLAVIYPHPGVDIEIWKAGACAVVVAVLTIVVVLQWKQRPYLLSGWLLYCGMLVPVIGLVQVGAQAMADRYTYVPLIGLFIIVSWGVAELRDRWGNLRNVVPVLAVSVLVILAWGTHRQLTNWRNSVTLFERALGVTERNWVAHLNLGLAFDTMGKTQDAVEQYRKAIAIHPGSVAALSNLGAALGKQGSYDEATTYLSKALVLSPDYARAHNNMGIVLGLRGERQEALSRFTKAIELMPEFADAQYNAGLVYSLDGRYDLALNHFLEASRLKPSEERYRRALDEARARIDGGPLPAGPEVVR